MNKNLILGIIIGAVVALGGTWAYKNYFCGCDVSKSGDRRQSAAIDQPAPDFILPAHNGQNVSLASLTGEGPVVLEWYNKDCPYVKKYYGSGHMQDLQKDYTAKGVKWVRIISSAPGKQGYLEGAELNDNHQGTNATYTLIDKNGTVGKKFGAKTTPHMFVITKQGNLAYGGAIDSIKSVEPSDIPAAENYVVAALDALMAGEKVAKTETTPYGCSVKY